jgi:hypothetical protein
MSDRRWASAPLAAVAAATLVAGCAGTGGSYGDDPRYRTYSQYDYDRADPSYGGYDASRYYVDNRRYRERRLAENDRVYRGQNGNYYCRRSDGTTGLLVGGVAGGILGNIIAPGGSGLLGSLLGGAAGAAVGQSIDRKNVRCR